MGPESRTQNPHEKLGRAVKHGRLLQKIGGGCHVAGNSQQPAEPLPPAQRQAYLRECISGAGARADIVAALERVINQTLDVLALTRANRTSNRQHSTVAEAAKPPWRRNMARLPIIYGMIQ